MTIFQTTMVSSASGLKSIQAAHTPRRRPGLSPAASVSGLILGIAATLIPSYPVTNHGHRLFAAPRAPAQSPVTLAPEVSNFLQQHCHACHSGNEAEGSLNLTSNSVAFDNPEVRRRWTWLYDRVADGEMPPPSAEQPDDRAKQTFLRTLGSTLTQADLGQRKVVLRRLNRNEYTNTVRDLFGVYVDVSRVLLDDSTDNGFDNVGSRLSISSEQMKLYVNAADVVLDHVFGPDRQPGQSTRTINFATNKRSPIGVSERKVAGGVIMFSAAKHLPLYGASAPVAGLYRIRAQVRAEQTTEPVVMHVRGGNTGRIGWHTAGFFEVPPGKTTTIEFTDRARESSDVLSFGLIGGYPQYKVNADEYEGFGLFLGDITIAGPIDEWSQTSRRLLGDAASDSGSLNDIRSILQTVIPRAFRRPVDDSELTPYVALARRSMDAGHSFQKSLRLALKGALCAPEFLYLEESPLRLPAISNGDADTDTLGTEQPGDSIDDFALASRLSYFLWSSLPDSELTSVADSGQLSEPKILRSQVNRMLSDPKSQRFVENFSGQWLRIRDIDFTVPDRRLYPEFNLLLRQSMIDETYAFFREILDKNLSVQNFIDSDFLMLNQPLAEFYGIDGVKGLDIRAVPRPPDSLRGGVMTQASILKVSADGTRTSPVLRGAWILNHLFGTPVPPPPASVDIVQPDIRGAETIREQLVKHRADPSCSRCHNKIDPPGFALESFDVLGARREWYRVRQGGKYIKRRIHPLSRANVQYKQGPQVDSTGVTPDGRPFGDIREYKRLLLAHETAMARSLTRLLLGYSLGRETGFADRAQTDRIVTNVKTKNYGLKSIIQEIVMSETFRSP